MSRLKAPTSEPVDACHCCTPAAARQWAPAAAEQTPADLWSREHQQADTAAAFSIQLLAALARPHYLDIDIFDGCRKLDA
jgi:cell division septation protein DedD